MKVGPPLSASGPNSGSSGAAAVPIKLPPLSVIVAPVSTPSRLNATATLPVTSVGVAVTPRVFPATIVWLSDVEPYARIPPPSCQPSCH